MVGYVAEREKKKKKGKKKEKEKKEATTNLVYNFSL